MMHFTNNCLYCGEEFTEANPCCCDNGTSDDGKGHVDGSCKRCCRCSPAGFNSGVGYYTRMDCDA